jgi:hypothetical protein
LHYEILLQEVSTISLDAQTYCPLYCSIKKELITMKRLTVMGLLVLLTVIVIGCATTSPLTFKGSESLMLKGTLMKPKGDGPFPAVVLLHGCEGMGGAGSDAYNRWASRLKSWGYLTLQVDSFGPRGDSFICSNPILPV